MRVGNWATVNDWFIDRTGYGNTHDWFASLESDDETMGLGEYVKFLRLDEGAVDLVVAGKTSAQILEAILLDRWKLGALDKDEVVMVHKFDLVDIDHQRKRWYSVLQVKGEGEIARRWLKL